MVNIAEADKVVDDTMATQHFSEGDFDLLSTIYDIIKRYKIAYFLMRKNSFLPFHLQCRKRTTR